MDVLDDNGNLKLPEEWQKRLPAQTLWGRLKPLIFFGPSLLGFDRGSRLRRKVNSVLRDRHSKDIEHAWMDFENDDPEVVHVVLDQLRAFGKLRSTQFLPGDSLELLCQFIPMKALLDDMCITLGVGAIHHHPAKNSLLYIEHLPRWWFIPSSALNGNLEALVSCLIEHRKIANRSSESGPVCHECRNHCDENLLIEFAHLRICPTCKPIFVQRIMEGVE